MPILGVTASQQVLRMTPPILTNLATWIDASDSGSVTLSSGKVSQINDLSGNNRHLVQATSTNQPTYSTGIKNGLNVMQFSGSQWVRQSSNWTPASTTTFYIVFRMTSGSLVTGWTDYHMDLMNYDNTYNTGAYQVNGGNITVQAATFDLANSTWYYSTLVRQTGNSAQTWLNTSQIASSASGSFAALGSGVLTLGTRSDGAAPFSGYMGEALMYDGTHNSTQIGEMQTYLATKWGDLMFAKFIDIDAFNSWIATINEERGFPNNNGTLTYSEPIIHANGSVIALIDDSIDFDGDIITREAANTLGYIDDRIDK